MKIFFVLVFFGLLSCSPKGDVDIPVLIKNSIDDIKINDCDTLELREELNFLLCDTIVMMDFIANTLEGQVRIKKYTRQINLKHVNKNGITLVRKGMRNIESLEQVIYNESPITKLETLTMMARGGSDGGTPGLQIWIFERGDNELDWRTRLAYTNLLGDRSFKRTDERGYVVMDWRNNYAFRIGHRSKLDSAFEYEYFIVIGDQVLTVGKGIYLKLEKVGTSLYNKHEENSL